MNVTRTLIAKTLKLPISLVKKENKNTFTVNIKDHKLDVLSLLDIKNIYVIDEGLDKLIIMVNDSKKY